MSHHDEDYNESFHIEKCVLYNQQFPIYYNYICICKEKPVINASHIIKLDKAYLQAVDGSRAVFCKMRKDAATLDTSGLVTMQKALLDLGIVSYKIFTLEINEVENITGK